MGQHYPSRHPLCDATMYLQSLCTVQCVQAHLHIQVLEHTNAAGYSLRPTWPVALTDFGTAGAIVGGEGGIGGTGSVITAGAFIKQLRSLAKDKSVKAVVLRVDSPGGDALASDLMWREIRQLAAKKPVVASMGDVAASGG